MWVTSVTEPVVVKIIIKIKQALRLHLPRRKAPPSAAQRGKTAIEVVGDVVMEHSGITSRERRRIGDNRHRPKAPQKGPGCEKYSRIWCLSSPYHKILYPIVFKTIQPTRPPIGSGKRNSGPWITRCPPRQRQKTMPAENKVSSKLTGPALGFGLCLSTLPQPQPHSGLPATGR